LDILTSRLSNPSCGSYQLSTTIRPKLKITARTLILYFHFDVIAFDNDFVTWNALLCWWLQNSAGFQVEIRTVPMSCTRLLVRVRPRAPWIQRTIAPLGRSNPRACDTDRVFQCWYDILRFIAAIKPKETTPPSLSALQFLLKTARTLSSPQSLWTDTEGRGFVVQNKDDRF